MSDASHRSRIATARTPTKGGASMPALTLFIIRHAEKPDEPVDPTKGPGLTNVGKEDPKSLIVSGWQRAGSWAALFGSGLSDAYPKPGVIYAANPNAAPAAGAAPDDPNDPPDPPSQRPFETISPLAAKLNKGPPVNEFAQNEEAALVADVVQKEGVVLICWEHKRIISAILPALLKGQANTPNVPKKWHGSRFDVVLRLDRSSANDPWKLKQMFPQLMAGDSDDPL
jgi:hypothetical protein